MNSSVSTAHGVEAEPRDRRRLWRLVRGVGLVVGFLGLAQQEGGCGTGTGAGNDGTKALYAAVATGDCRLVRKALDEGADVNAVLPWPRGTGVRLWTPLCIAAYNRWTDMARVLIECGADVNWADERGDRAVHLAGAGDVGSRASPDLKVLRDGGATLDVVNELGMSPLHYACSRRDFPAIELLLNEGVDARRRDVEGETALDFLAAASWEDEVYSYSSGPEWDVIAKLVEASGQRGKELAGWRSAYEGYTLLHLAAQQGHTGFACIWVAAGGPVSPRAQGGVTPLMIARLGRYRELQAFLERQERSRSTGNVGAGEENRRRSQMPSSQPVRGCLFFDRGRDGTYPPPAAGPVVSRSAVIRSHRGAWGESEGRGRCGRWRPDVSTQEGAP